MLMAVRRKVVYMLVAASMVLLLIGAPSVVPAAHAECIPVHSSQCGG